MTDATTADRIPLELFVDEALRDAEQRLQRSDEEELGKLAESLVDTGDLESRTTSPVVRAPQVVATRVVATPASQHVIPQFAVAGVAVASPASPTKRQKQPIGWVCKEQARLYQQEIVRRALTPHPRQNGRRHVPMRHARRIGSTRRSRVTRPSPRRTTFRCTRSAHRSPKPKRGLASHLGSLRDSQPHWCVGAARVHSKSVCLCNDTTVYS